MADPRRSRGWSAVVETYNRGRQPSAVAVPSPPRNRSVQVETHLMYSRGPAADTRLRTAVGDTQLENTEPPKSAPPSCDRSATASRKWKRTLTVSMDSKTTPVKQTEYQLQECICASICQHLDLPSIENECQLQGAIPNYVSLYTLNIWTYMYT